MAAYAALVSLMNIIHDIQRHHSPPISLDPRQLQSLTQVLTYLQEFLEAYNSPVADGDEVDPLEMRITDAAYAAEDVIESHIVDKICLQNQQTSSPADSDEPDVLEMLRVVGAEPVLLEMLRAVGAEDVIESQIVDKIHLQNQQTSYPADSNEPDQLEMLRAVGAEPDQLEMLRAVGAKFDLLEMLRAVVAEDVTESHIVDKIHLQNQQTSSPADSDEPDQLEMLRAVGAKFDLLEMLRAFVAEDVTESHIVDKIHLQNQQTSSPADSDEPDQLEMLKAVGAKFDLLEMLRAVVAEDVTESHIVDKIHLQNQQTNSLADSDEPDISERLRAVGAEDVIESQIVDKIHLQNQQTSSPADSDEPDLLEMLRAVVAKRVLLELLRAIVAERVLLEMLRAVGAQDVIESQIVDKIHLQIQQTSSLADSDEPDISERLRAVGAEDVIESHIMDEIHLQNQQTSSPADSDEPDIPERLRAVRDEDVIESHIVDKIHLQNQQTSSLASNISGSFNCFRAPKKPENVDDEQIRSINFYQDLKLVIEEMDSIKLVAMKIDTGKAVVDRDISASDAPLRSFSSSSAMVYPESVIGGIMEKLTTRNRGLDLQVIPIVGMGGIGKTTLARNIYACELIQEHFPVCAWATVSQQYNTREILCEVLSQATNKKKEELIERSEAKLGLELHKYLFGGKFLIVLDDMWSIDAWENIKHFFPNNQNGSRILVTTRLLQLSSQLNTNYTHQMKFLDEDSSWDLFSKTVFGERSCPLELVKIGKMIVNNCRGLPLSIVVVGGILKNMDHTLGCWEAIRNNLTSKVNLENDKHCLRLLKLSYNHLPVYLKPCFLYMGVFEEDDEIKVSTIIKLWVSEGFLKPMNDRSSETIAMGFIKDLVDRNLIMIYRLGSTGNIKSCKIHDLLRDLCLNEVQKDGFYHAIGRSQGINRQCRRIVIPRINASEEKVREGMQSMPRARSVICENGKVPRCRNSGLLRTFHAYKFRTYKDQSYMNSLAFQYVNLRHLAVEVGSMSSFFSSITLFWNLHTLIVSCPKNNHSITAPSEIWKMPQFRHIEFDKQVCLPDPPSGKDEDIVIMENLRILKGVKNFKCCGEVVKRIPNIKKLAIRYWGQLKDTLSDDYYCVGNIKSLSKLESLDVSCDRQAEGAPYLHKLSCPDSLKKLTLEMNIEFDWEKILEMIGSLPCLEKLKLWSGCFRTGKWEIAEDHFPELKYLGLFHCPGLKQWTAVGSPVFPRLQHLYLFVIKELEEIPLEIGDTVTLKKISIVDCSESAVRSAKVLVEEQVENQGEQLSFQVHVQVAPANQNEELMSLADPPNFIMV